MVFLSDKGNVGGRGMRMRSIGEDRQSLYNRTRTQA